MNEVQTFYHEVVEPEAFIHVGLDESGVVKVSWYDLWKEEPTVDHTEAVIKHLEAAAEMLRKRIGS